MADVNVIVPNRDVEHISKLNNLFGQVFLGAFWNAVKLQIMTNVIALGLRPDVSQFALLINYCFLIARCHIWLAKSNENYPNLKQFVCLLKSQYEIETKKEDTKKWKPLAGYINV